MGLVSTQVSQALKIQIIAIYSYYKIVHYNVTHRIIQP
jgi:hypothetical protein